jgi:hypothetical protein
MTITTEATIEGIAEFILSKSADRIILVGPLVFQPSDGTAAAVRYMMVCTGDEEKEFHCDRVFCHDEEGRADLISALTHPGFVINLMDDELEMARLCEALWPCEKISRLKTALEAERAAA